MYLLSEDAPPPYNPNRLWDYGLWEIVQSEIIEGDPNWVYFPCSEEGISLFEQWQMAPGQADKPITGVLCDWLQDHRELLLSGAVGPNPAERLEQVIDWFRQHFERGGYAHAG